MLTQGTIGDVELEPLRHDEDRGELAQHREPAQPQDGVQADMPLRGAEVGGGESRSFRPMWRCRSRITNRAAQRNHRITSLALSAAIAEERPSMTGNDKASSRPTVADRSSSAAIAVDHLVKVYKQTRAVDDISFSLPRGSITGLLGGNGAGKTTTIAMIMGLVLPTSGRVQVLGHRMPEQSAAVLGRMNFESPYVDMPMRLTVRQNLTVFGKLYAVKNVSDRIAKLADELDLTEFIDRANGKLSAGQKTRVALAKALINQPELLLLDEPTASLDPDTADWVRAHLERYRKDEQRHHPSGLAQHARGRAAVRPRHHHEARPHRGRRHAGGHHGALQPHHAGGGVPGRRARAGERCEGGGAMTELSLHRGISIHRIGAMILRYWYLLMSSWPRLLELLYWPALQVITWGFLQLYIAQNANFFARAGGTLIGAVILWDILFRGQLGFSISFLEEMWARNIGNLMMSPLEADRVSAVADDHEHDPARDRRHPDDAARAVPVSLQRLCASACR